MKNKLLICPKCESNLIITPSFASCKTCKKKFKRVSGIIDFREELAPEKDYESFQESDDPYNLKSQPHIIKEGHRLKEDIIKNILKKINIKGKTVLDFGSGQKIPSFLLGCKTGVVQDISINALRKSKKKSKTENFIHVASNKKIPCKANSLDLILAGEIIEHVNDVNFVIKEFKRVLKQGGYLIITTPNKKALVFRALGFEYSKCEQHISLQDYKSILNLLKPYFKIEEVKGVNQSFFHYIDKILPKRMAKHWARLFLNRPWDATGMVVFARKFSQENS